MAFVESALASFKKAAIYYGVGVSAVAGVQTINDAPREGQAAKVFAQNAISDIAFTGAVAKLGIVYVAETLGDIGVEGYKAAAPAGSAPKGGIAAQKLTPTS